MGKAGAAIIVGMLATVLWAGSALGGNHDRDCMAPASPLSDASDTWSIATALTDRDCTGELSFPDDNDDWFYVTGALSAGSVSLCPTSIGLAPFNPDLEVYLRATTSTYIPFQHLLPPGVPLGLGLNAEGCDTATIPAPLTGASTRVYVHVHRTTGDGLYHLVVS